jgi:hypothetical protein
MGVRLNSTLNGRSASEIAFASAAGGPIGPPSPTPLTPSGLSGDGEDVAVVEEASGRIGVAKVLTTPGDLAAGVLHALQSAVHRYDVVNTEVALLSHATTVVTNAILEEKGARAALITTRGFRDVLELRPSRAKATSAVCRIATAPKDTA